MAMFAGTSFVGRGGQGLAKFQAQLSAITGQPLLSLLSKVVRKIHIKVPKIQNPNMMSFFLIFPLATSQLQIQPFQVYQKSRTLHPKL